MIQMRMFWWSKNVIRLFDPSQFARNKNWKQITIIENKQTKTLCTASLIITAGSDVWEFDCHFMVLWFYSYLCLETKSLKLSQSSATLGTCCLQEVAAITHCKCAWGKFRQLLPLLTNRYLPLLTRDKVWGVWCCIQRLGPWRWIHWTASGVMTMPWSVGSAMSGQRTKLAQTPFSQSLASRT